MPIVSIFSRYVINFSVYTNCHFCFCGIVEIAVDLTLIWCKSRHIILWFLWKMRVYILTYWLLATLSMDIGCQCALLIWLVSGNLVKITSPYMHGISLQLTYSVYIQLITILQHSLQKYGKHIKDTFIVYLQLKIMKCNQWETPFILVLKLL